MKPEIKNVVELDVRPILEAGGEPFHAIMEKVNTLKPDDLFVLHATFKPTPLLNMMSHKGFSNEAKQVEQGYWVVHFWKEENTIDKDDSAG